jgi:hypothetical protein
MAFYLFLLQVVAGVVAFGFAAVVLAIAVSMVISIVKQARQPKQPEQPKD